MSVTPVAPDPLTPGERVGDGASANHAGGPVQAPVRPVPVSVVRRRRRPSGEPPPLPRKLERSDKAWLVLAGLVAVTWITIAATPLGVLVDRADLALIDRVVALRTDGVTTVMRGVHALGSEWVARIVRWGAVAALVAFRRWRHLFVFFAAMVLVETVTGGMALIVQRMRPPVEILAAWDGFSHPSRAVAGLTATIVGLAYALCPPRRWRLTALWVGAGCVLALGAARVYLGVDHPTDVLFGTVIAGAITTLTFRWFAPETVFPVVYRRGRTAHLAIDAPRASAIRAALEDQLGMVVRDIRPVGLAGSAGSTPLRIRVVGEQGDTTVFAKLYAANHLRADRWYKLGRALRYGRLEDEVPFESVRRLVQYEDYLLRVMRDTGLPVPTPFGFVEITPEREYLLVTEFFEGATESTEATVDEAVIDDALRVVRRLWLAGLAHRDIKPANVMVRDGRVLLIDPAFGQVRPSPWRQAVDLANMMIVLALRSDAETVYRRALRYFSADEIAEALAATSEATRPSLHKMLRADGRDLLRRFRALAPPHPRIRIQRWSARRVALTARVLAVTLLITAFLVGQLQTAGLL